MSDAIPGAARREPRVPTFGESVVAVAILGTVTTVGINAISASRRRPIPEIAEDVLGVVLHGVAT